MLGFCKAYPVTTESGAEGAGALFAHSMASSASPAVAGAAAGAASAAGAAGAGAGAAGAAGAAAGAGFDGFDNFGWSLNSMNSMNSASQMSSQMSMWPMASMGMAMPAMAMAMGDGTWNAMAMGMGMQAQDYEEDEDPLNPDNDPNRFSGRIKTYYETPGGGYGFIDCELARMRYGRDVYLHSRQISDAKVGEMISFTIVRNAKGEPQARNVMRAEEAMALKAKIQRRERREQEQKRMKHQALERAVVPELRGVMSEEEAKRFQESLKKKRL